MSTRFVVPLRTGCSSSQTVMPAGLYPYVHSDEFTASMQRIRSANRSPLGALFIYCLAWVGYVFGVLQVIGMPYGYYYSQFWTGFGVLLTSLFVIIAVGRYMRNKKIAQVSAAVATEHALYSTRPVPITWRVVSHGWKQHAVEVEVNNNSVQQQQIDHLQHQLAMWQREAQHAQHHVQHDHHVIEQQAEQLAHQHQPQPAYYPVVQPMVQVERPVYVPVNGSVFAHPPPQYYASTAPTQQYVVQPVDHMRAPLMRNAY